MSENSIIIAEKYSQLPESLQDFLSSPTYSSSIKNIGDKYHLHIDQLGNLSELVTMTIIGLSSSSDFRSKLKRATGVQEDILNLIIYDLNQQLFSKIREELAKMTEQSDESRGQTSAPQQLFEQKMSGVTGAPKQTVEVKSQTGDNKEEVATTKPPRDPYRESIN